MDSEKKNKKKDQREQKQTNKYKVPTGGCQSWGTDGIGEGIKRYKLPTRR